MPKDLPGFYWDEERNRYFPLSSRPKQASPPPETITRNHHKNRTKGSFEASNEKSQKYRQRGPVTWRANEKRFSTESYTQNMRNSQSVLCLDPLLPSKFYSSFSPVIFYAGTTRRPQAQLGSRSQQWVLFTHFVYAYCSVVVMFLTVE
jgi:WD repeat-containing protein 21A